MTDGHVLLLVLVVIYAWDCLVWVRRGGLAFTTWLGRGWRPRFPSAVAGNVRGGWVFGAPLPPFGSVVLASPAPVSASPAGVFGYTSGSLDPLGRPAQSEVWIPWGELGTVRVRGPRLESAGKLLCRVQGEAAAVELASRLNALAAASAQERERLLRDWIVSGLDAEAARRRWGEAEVAARPLRAWCTGQFLVLFGLLPAVVFWTGLGRGWPWVVGALGVHAVVVGRLFYRASHGLYPAAADERFTQTMVTLLSPPSAVRASEQVCRSALACYHPLAIARAFDQPAAVAQLARRTLAELRYPIRPEQPAGVPEEAVRAERWWRAAWVEAVVRALEGWGLDAAAIAGPPKPLESQCRTWCPRCDQQFTVAAGECRGCGGLPLQPLAP